MARALRKQIATDGYAVSVAVPVLGQPGFAYTAGLHRAGHPELLVIGGLCPPEQYLVLHSLAQRMRAGERFAPGQRESRLLDGVDVAFVEVIDTGSEHFEVVNDVQSDYRALQIVWPDHSHRFPWDDGYDVPPELQPLLGLPA